MDARSNDYLGLAALGVSRETIRGGERVGAGAARLVAGTWPEHLEVEAELASWLQQEACLLFSSGYAANVGALSALAGPGETIFSDALNHASIIDGCRLSRAEVVVLPHRNLDALASALRASRGVRWVVTETYFGMDGDTPDLEGIRRLCDEHDAALIVDEAHALGVFGPEGRGLCAARGVVPDVFVGGIGKALGVQGGFVAAARIYRDWLWNRARSQVFSTGTSPLLARMVGERVRIARSADARREHLARLVGAFDARLRGAGISVPAGRHGPVFPILIGGEAETMAAAQALRGHGVAAQPIRPPTVPAGASRLRVTLRADMEAGDVELLATAVVEVVRELGAAGGAGRGSARAQGENEVPGARDVEADRGGAQQRSGVPRSSGHTGALADAAPETGGARGDAGRGDAQIDLRATVPRMAANQTSGASGWGGTTGARQGAPREANRGADGGIRRWVVLGTGTEVGKTYVSCALLRAARLRGAAAGGVKPIETGLRGSGGAAADASALATTSFHVKHPPNHPLYGFPDPVTPSLAARQSGTELILSEVVRWVDSVRFTSEPNTARHLVIETAGGAFSPLSARATNYDLARALDPATWVLVAPNRLGVLHDVGSCLRALAALGRVPDVVILSAPAQADASTPHNADELRHQGISVPVIELPRNGEAELAALFELKKPTPRLAM